MSKSGNKITALRKKVDIKIESVDNLMNLLATSQDDAGVLLLQIQTELDKAEEDFKSVQAGYNELKNRCYRVSKFVDKVLEA